MMMGFKVLMCRIGASKYSEVDYNFSNVLLIIKQMENLTFYLITLNFILRVL